MADHDDDFKTCVFEPQAPMWTYHPDLDLPQPSTGDMILTSSTLDVIQFVVRPKYEADGGMTFMRVWETSPGVTSTKTDVVQIAEFNCTALSPSSKNLIPNMYTNPLYF